MVVMLLGQLSLVVLLQYLEHPNLRIDIQIHRYSLSPPRSILGSCFDVPQRPVLPSLFLDLLTPDMVVSLDSVLHWFRNKIISIGGNRLAFVFSKKEWGCIYGSYRDCIHVLQMVVQMSLPAGSCGD